MSLLSKENYIFESGRCQHLMFYPSYYLLNMEVRCPQCGTKVLSNSFCDEFCINCDWCNILSKNYE